LNPNLAARPQIAGLPAQTQEAAMPVQEALVRLQGELRPVQPRALERRALLRVGHVPGLPAESLELLHPAAACLPRDPGISVVGEEEERGARSPLLAHKEHGHEW